MLALIAQIHWDVSPEIFHTGGFAPRWYGVLFALGLLFAYLVMKKFYREEGKPVSELDILSVYIVAGTIIGARLGHCLFYGTSYYLSHPLEIVKFWEGGLASHGAAIGIVLAIWLYSRKKDISTTVTWIFDRIVIVTCLAGTLIRLGNLMNSEILGTATDLPWAFVFARVDNVPRHPAQLYEAIFYLFTFFILYNYYNKSKNKDFHGIILGMFFVIVFSFRFVIELVKEHQSELLMNSAIDMGSVLSIPFIIAGVVLILQANRKIKNTSNKIS
ncbi:MAG: prolipoprotein diacylglyceryl transferase [Ignavibacteriae bacterium]|nr:prolipoprotein diacylglyceryl transferase [Ignavibacteriota bacterium]MCB9243087.1 prolipoprotein diacylglyceryl transferase [Ignavibacteriales bacterium]